MRVGIVTFHCSYNFGSALQAFALRKVLVKLGHEASVVDYRSKNYFDNYRIINPDHIRGTLRALKHLGRYQKRKEAFELFARETMCLTDKTYTYKDESALEELQGEFDCFVCGSDQIWNLDATHGVIGPFFLSFAGDARRVAYAPSLAQTSFKSEYFDKSEVAELLEKFDAISVREEETVGLFQPLVKKEIKVALDPTMLLDTAEYADMLPRASYDEPYMFIYLLRSCPELVESAVALTRHTNIRVLYVSDNDLPIPNSENLLGIGPDQFVSLVAHAEAVLTNSFHATVFSLKFHRPFRVFATDMSASRMRDLLEELKVADCLSNKIDARPLKEPDWDDIDKRIASLCKESLSFLGEALT